MIDATLISTALLAAQQQKEFWFCRKSPSAGKTGFIQQILVTDAHPDSEFIIIIYMDTESPTGYAIEVQAVAAIKPGILLLGRHIKNFEDFEKLMAADYSKMAYDKTQLIRTSQLQKKIKWKSEESLMEWAT